MFEGLASGYRVYTRQCQLHQYLLLSVSCTQYVGLGHSLASLKSILLQQATVSEGLLSGVLYRALTVGNIKREAGPHHPHFAIMDNPAIQLPQQLDIQPLDFGRDGRRNYTLQGGPASYSCNAGL